MSCIDIPGTDSWGDGCASYAANPAYCTGGLFNTDTFQAEINCCGCGGGERTEVEEPEGPPCYDYPGQDSYGDNC